MNATTKSYTHSPWNETITKATSPIADSSLREQISNSMLGALQAAYAKGFANGRRSGYDEAEMHFTPTRHDMGG